MISGVTDVYEPEVLAWLDEKSAWVYDLRPPVDELFIRESVALALGHVIVPLPYAWNRSSYEPDFECDWDEENRGLARRLRQIGYSQLFCIEVTFTTHRRLAVPTTAKAMETAVESNASYCFFLTQDEKISFVHTGFNYWIASGPKKVVEFLLGFALTEAYARFETAGKEGFIPDYNEQASKEVLDRAIAHNEQVSRTNWVGRAQVEVQRLAAHVKRYWTKGRSAP